MKLTGDEVEFLGILAHYGSAVPRSLLPLADRKQDRVRQKCKRLGLAEFVGGWVDGRRLPYRWRITLAGRAALEKERG